MFSLRNHVLISVGLFAAIFLVPLALRGLQSTGTFGSASFFEMAVKVSIFVVFLAFGYSMLPLMLKIFLAGQRTIGNARLGPIKWIDAHQGAVIVGAWLIISLGLVIAIPAAIDDEFFGAGTQRGANALLRGKSQGLLVAKPGMEVGEMFRVSTLKINDGGMNRRDLPGYSAGAVFDFQAAGTGMILQNCQYYFISTYTHDVHHIEAINIGTSPDKLTRAALEAADATLRVRLATNGWLTGHEEYRTEKDRQLHGGKSRGEEGSIWLKDGTVLHIESRRMDDSKPDEDVATAGEWIQYIELWERSNFSGIERFAFAPPKR